MNNSEIQARIKQIEQDLETVMSFDIGVGQLTLALRSLTEVVKELANAMQPVNDVHPILTSKNGTEGA